MHTGTSWRILSYDEHHGPKMSADQCYPFLRCQDHHRPLFFLLPFFFQDVWMSCNVLQHVTMMTAMVSTRIIRLCDRPTTISSSLASGASR